MASHLAFIAFVFAILVGSGQALATTRTWTQYATAQSANGTNLQTIDVVGQRINWGAGVFDLGFPDISMSTSSPGSVSSFTLTMLDFHAKLSALNIAKVCGNPSLPQAMKNTTSESSTLDRWFVASEMVAQLHARSAWAWYDKAVPPITIIVDSKALKGFKVWYKDGFSETWVFLPNANFSAAKLSDTPAPESLKPDGPGC
jgi:hypothetical protein